WNGPGGERWLNRQQAQDALLAPVADVLLGRAAAHPGEIVLDIGCGCGSTSIALAQRVAPRGHVLGVDVSAPLRERARELAPRARHPGPPTTRRNRPRAGRPVVRLEPRPRTRCGARYGPQHGTCESGARRPAGIAQGCGGRVDPGGARAPPGR